VRSLGFILGDEGSGAALGRHFTSDCMKDLAPKEIADEFFDKFKVTTDDIMDAVYTSAFPNRSLSTFSFFLSEHLDNDYVYNLVYNEIMLFFRRNLAQYEYKDYPVCFVGSIACIYSDVLKTVASNFGVEIKKIVRASMPGMVEYHAQE
jgi:N-acetylglucosamine kinase-like BadF-type ATPase